MWMTDTVLFISGTELESQGKKREGCMQHKASAQAKKKKAMRSNDDRGRR